MTKKAARFALILILALSTVACDQAGKGIARRYLKGRQTVFLVEGFLVLHYVENEGAFLGLGSDLPVPIRTIAFSVFPFILLGGFLLMALRKKEIGVLDCVGIACLLGGGSSNLFDRLANQGRVSDFINIGIGRVRTGIFNFADLFILIGSFAVILAMAEKEKREVA